jgi:hypothetical protein
MDAGLLEVCQLERLLIDRFMGASRLSLSFRRYPKSKPRTEMCLRGHRKLLNEKSQRLFDLLSETLEGLGWLWAWSRGTHVFVRIGERPLAVAAVAPDWRHEALMWVFYRRMEALHDHVVGARALSARVCELMPPTIRITESWIYLHLEIVREGFTAF